MKTINYTGSSKLIARIVSLLNRKAPLPLDGDGDPDWGTNGQVLSTDGAGNTAWVNQGGGGSGGHTIEDASGTDMPAEDNLQFADAKVTDDSGNSRTKVEVIRPITESQVSSISEDGVYLVTDGQQISIDAANVVYNGGSVASALNTQSAASGVSYDNTTSGLSATNVQGAVDEVATLSAKQTFTPSSYTSWSIYGGCYYRKRGTTVELNVALEGVAAQLSAVVGTLPTGYRPLHPIGSSAISIQWNALGIGALFVDEQGVIRISSSVGDTYFIGRIYFETV